MKTYRKRNPKIQPIIIELETQEELDTLYTIISKVQYENLRGNPKYTEKIHDELFEELGYIIKNDC